jgi:hypothetical protein
VTRSRGAIVGIVAVVIALACVLLFVTAARTLSPDGCMWILGIGGCF